MVFVIDVGNTNIVLGTYENGKLLFTSRMSTQAARMEDEYAIDFKNILKLYNINNSNFEGAIISSVVPRLIPALQNAVKKAFNCDAIIVKSTIKTGLKIKTDDHSAVGADLICGAVGALKNYSLPMAIFDLGTATTICAIDNEGNYLGGSILPGVNTSLNALISGTAQLPQVNLSDFDESIIGTNTKDAIRSGLIYGTASMMDGMIEKYKEVLGEHTTIIATGGLASSIAKYCKSNVIIDDNLLLKGLYELYKMNKLKTI